MGLYDGNSGPGSLLHGLTLYGALTEGTSTFRAPANTILAASTKYYVYISASAGTFTIRRTDSNAEDAGAAAGWNIEDESYSGGTKLNITGIGQSEHKIAIRGYAN